MFFVELRMVGKHCVKAAKDVVKRRLSFNNKQESISMPTPDVESCNQRMPLLGENAGKILEFSISC